MQLCRLYYDFLLWQFFLKLLPQVLKNMLKSLSWIETNDGMNVLWKTANRDLNRTYKRVLQILHNGCSSAFEELHHSSYYQEKKISVLGSCGIFSKKSCPYDL